MSEFLHEIVRKREQSNYSTSVEFQTHINAIMEGNTRQLRERLAADPWLPPVLQEIVDGTF